MCSLAPPVMMMLPNASTVPGWQLAQLVSVIVGSWLGVFGGIPWQVPHETWPVDVHTGRPGPWHVAVAQVCAVRSQPRLAVTFAGPVESRWPGESTAVGTT